jgi:hypothetical protein
MGNHVISQKKQEFLPFPSSFGRIAFLVGPTQKLSFLPFLMINQTKESRIFFNLSLLPLSFLQVSLKPNIVKVL